jgi:uncharacterized protein
MLDLRSLRLQPGDVRREQLEVALGPLVLGGQTYAVAPAPVRALLQLQATTGGMYMKLGFSAALTGPCYRCLEPARVTLEVAASEYQASNPDPGTEEEMSSDYLEEGQLDVARWANDALVFALPDKILCRADCVGLCPNCGVRLVPGDDHRCREPERDPRWAKLQELL